MSARPPLSQFSVRQVLIVAALVLVSSFGVGLARLAWTAHALHDIEVEETGRVQALQGQMADTEKQIALAKTDDYVRTWARETAKLTLAGEVPIILVVPPAAPAPAAAAGPMGAQPAPPPPSQDDGVPRWKAMLDGFLSGQ
ncbi:MAG: hypothetical protein U0641_02535 [Anaerolineae bacterium]